MSSYCIMVVMWGEKIIRHTTQRIQNFNQIHVIVNDYIRRCNHEAIIKAKQSRSVYVKL